MASSPIAPPQLVMNQYVVDSAEQTSGFGAYSLTYPYVGELAAPFELISLEFLAKDH